MAEALVKTFKRDYVSIKPIPDAEAVIVHLPDGISSINRSPSPA